MDWIIAIYICGGIFTVKLINDLGWYKKDMTGGDSLVMLVGVSFTCWPIILLVAVFGYLEGYLEKHLNR